MHGKMGVFQWAIFRCGFTLLYGIMQKTMVAGDEKARHTAGNVNGEQQKCDGDQFSRTSVSPVVSHRCTRERLCSLGRRFRKMWL
jgi:hypothetical protein